jgi:hypothetical protein
MDTAPRDIWHLACLLDKAGLPHAGAQVFGPYTSLDRHRCASCRTHVELSHAAVSLLLQPLPLPRNLALEMMATMSKVEIADHFGYTVSDVERILAGS